MSDTPETDEAFERWRQGKLNIFDEMARLERERNKFKKELVAANRGAETNAKINNSLIDKLIAMRNERDEARNIARWLYQHGMATLKEGAYRRPWVKEVIQ